MTDRCYEFRVDGALPAVVREAVGDLLGDLEVREVRPGAVLRGAVIDDAHLHGVLEQLRLLGLTVVSAHPLPATPEP